MENASLGFGHFLLQADVVGKTLLAILVVMSVASWALIAVKGFAHLVRKRRTEGFLSLFWNATSLDEVH
ncbi:MAG TPA: MotA/TolQ/ExbB proton channel family protein, partial [Burkholderiaceae bacterium]